MEGYSDKREIVNSIANKIRTQLLLSIYNESITLSKSTHFRINSKTLKELSSSYEIPEITITNPVEIEKSYDNNEIHISSLHSSNKSLSTMTPSPCTEDTDSNPGTFFFGRKKTVSEYKINSSDNNKNTFNKLCITKKEKIVASCKILRKLCRSYKKLGANIKPKESIDETKER